LVGIGAGGVVAPRSPKLGFRQRPLSRDAFTASDVAKGSGSGRRVDAAREIAGSLNRQFRAPGPSGRPWQKRIIDRKPEKGPSIIRIGGASPAAASFAATAGHVGSPAANVTTR